MADLRPCGGGNKVKGKVHLWTDAPNSTEGFVILENLEAYTKIKITPSYVNGNLSFYGSYTSAVRYLAGSDLITTLSSMVSGTTYEIALGGRSQVAIKESSGANYRDVTFSYELS